MMLHRTHQESERSIYSSIITVVLIDFTSELKDGMARRSERNV